MKARVAPILTSALLLFLVFPGFAAADEFPPTVEISLIRKMLAKTPAEHPRLLVTGQDFRSLRQSIVPGSLKRHVADHVIAQAEELLEQRPSRELSRAAACSVNRAAVWSAS